MEELDPRDPRPCGACLVLKQVPKVPQRVVLGALTKKVKNRIANTFFKYKIEVDGEPLHGFMHVYLNFHTIMEAEATLAEQPVVMIEGNPFSFQWATEYSMDKVLVVAFFDDFPVDELLQLFDPYAVIQDMFKLPEYPKLIFVRPTTYQGVRQLQRNLHGTLFKGRPLYMGSELPGCATLTSKMYHSIAKLKPTVEELHFEVYQAQE